MAVLSTVTQVLIHQVQVTDDVCVWLFLGVHVTRQRRGEKEKPKEEKESFANIFWPH